MANHDLSSEKCLSITFPLVQNTSLQIQCLHDTPTTSGTYCELCNSVLELGKEAEEEVVTVGGNKPPSLFLLTCAGLLKPARHRQNILGEVEAHEFQGSQ